MVGQIEAEIYAAIFSWAGRREVLVRARGRPSDTASVFRSFLSVRTVLVARWVAGRYITAQLLIVAVFMISAAGIFDIWSSSGLTGKPRPQLAN
jgi:hypothetical protein